MRAVSSLHRQAEELRLQPIELVTVAPLRTVVLSPAPRFPLVGVGRAGGRWYSRSVTIFVFSLIALLRRARFPAYRNMSARRSGYRMPAVVVGAQAAAYPVVLAVHLHAGAEPVADEPFRQGDPLELAGQCRRRHFSSAERVLALVVEGLSRFLPIPKSLPMDNFFHDATSAYMMAAFGMTLAPLLEELFFRGLLYPAAAARLRVTGRRVLLTALAFAAIHGAQLGYAWAPVSASSSSAWSSPWCAHARTRLRLPS